MKAAVDGPPRQMTGYVDVRRVRAGRQGPLGGRSRPKVCVVAVKTEAAGKSLRKINGFAAGFKWVRSGPGLSLRRIVVPDLVARNARPLG